ncbi:GNAT family N-acetyltransferase [Hyphomonas oceanitis]|uniref:GNAT family N-acetyltransferase n=1 Tax=Hyphomonas oceanitis TaxID=81033 RepID=UPI0030037FC3
MMPARLQLRKRVLADLDFCLAMDVEPGVTRFVIGPWADPIAHRDFLLANIHKTYRSPFGYWMIENPAAPEPRLGWVMAIEEDDGSVELGWRLRPAAWGQGVATEAAQLLLESITKADAGRKCVALIQPGNGASIRVAQKLGFESTGREIRDGVGHLVFARLMT